MKSTFNWVITSLHWGYRLHKSPFYTKKLRGSRGRVIQRCTMLFKDNLKHLQLYPCFSNVKGLNLSTRYSFIQKQMAPMCSSTKHRHGHGAVFSALLDIRVPLAAVSEQHC